MHSEVAQPCICENHSPPNSLPIQAGASCWAECPVLYSRSLLLIHFKYGSVYMDVWVLSKCKNITKGANHKFAVCWMIKNDHPSNQQPDEETEHQQSLGSGPEPPLAVTELHSSPPPHWQPLSWFLPGEIGFCCFRTSCQWDITICFLFTLAAFA